MKNFFFTVYLSIIMVPVILGAIMQCSRSDDPSTSEEQIESKYDSDTLTEWQIFTMALMKVESGYNPDAVSSAGARGYFQITPIYVKEVNRIHGTNYSFEQVDDFEYAYEIFDMMQKAHNHEYDIEKALTLHNGESPWYHKKVRQEMERIRKYEDMRMRLKAI